jgi:hypothetical protein
MDNTEFYKESLKLETEKMKIYAVFFAGLVTVIGSILLKESFTTFSLIVLTFAITFTIVMSLLLVSSFVKTNRLVNLLKKK